MATETFENMTLAFREKILKCPSSQGPRRPDTFVQREGVSKERGDPSLGTLEGMLRKSLDTGISLPFLPKGTWYVVCSYTGDFDR
jgi:hypothetical protein